MSRIVAKFLIIILAGCSVNQQHEQVGKTKSLGALVRNADELIAFFTVAGGRVGRFLKLVKRTDLSLDDMVYLKRLINLIKNDADSAIENLKILNDTKKNSINDLKREVDKISKVVEGFDNYNNILQKLNSRVDELAELKKKRQITINEKSELIRLKDIKKSLVGEMEDEFAKLETKVEALRYKIGSGLRTDQFEIESFLNKAIISITHGKVPDELVNFLEVANAWKKSDPNIRKHIAKAQALKIITRKLHKGDSPSTIIYDMVASSGNNHDVIKLADSVRDKYTYQFSNGGNSFRGYLCLAGEKIILLLAVNAKGGNQVTPINESIRICRSSRSKRQMK